MGLRYVFALWLISALCFNAKDAEAQDTFSIVGLDTLTGEVGSAGASCVDLFQFGITDIGFLGDLFPGKGAINTQAAYNQSNQLNARTRMVAGDTPAQIISWLQANDIQSNPEVRQYGIVAMVSGTPQSAGHTGTNCLTYKNHITGRNYSIQGNILSGQNVLDSMEKKFKATPGTLACKLMAALQGAKMVGADTRCAPNNSSSLFAFLKVAKNDDPDGSPYISIGVRTATNTFIEPIDSLQTIANSINLCSITTSVNENKEMHSVGFFPNPVSHQLNIVNLSSFQTSELRVLNALGQTVFYEIGNVRSVSTEEFLPGIYFAELKFTGTEKRKAFKFVKQ